MSNRKRYNDWESLYLFFMSDDDSGLQEAIKESNLPPYTLEELYKTATSDNAPRCAQYLRSLLEASRIETNKTQEIEQALREDNASLLLETLLPPASDPNFQAQLDKYQVIQKCGEYKLKNIAKELCRRYNPNLLSRGLSLLSSAIEAHPNDTGFMKYLIDLGVSVKAHPSQDACETPLGIAAGKNSISAIDLLIREGANINERSGSRNKAPIFMAARSGNARTVGHILRLGASARAPSSGGWTPMHTAASCNNLEAVQVLLSAGASANATDSTGSKPIEYTTNAAIKEVLTIHSIYGAA